MCKLLSLVIHLDFVKGTLKKPKNLDLVLLEVLVYKHLSRSNILSERKDRAATF